MNEQRKKGRCYRTATLPHSQLQSKKERKDVQIEKGKCPEAIGRQDNVS